jgi:glutamate:GABA antiporter
LSDSETPGPKRSLPGAGISIAEAEDPNLPRRALGFRDLLLFYVVTGISLRWIATAAAAGPSSIVIWIGAWLCFYTPLALSVVELSSRYPGEGGMYVWSKRAFGDFAGFITAWSYWTCNLPYYPAVLYFAASNALYIRRDEWLHLEHSPTFFITFMLVTLAVATWLNIIGLDVGTWLHNLGALAMWIPALIVIAMGAVSFHRFGSATAFNAHTLLPSIHLKDMIFWSVLIYAFDGCEAASFMGDEIKNSRRAIPWALFTAGLTVAFCYIIGTVGVLLALPASEVGNLQGLMQAVSATAHKIHWEGIIPFAAFLIMLSNIGAAGAFIASGARLPYVAGIDRFLPPIFGALHPRWKTPWFGLLSQFVLGAILVFLGQAGTSIKGAYDVLVAMGVITNFIPYLFLFASMFKLQAEPAGPQIIRVPGGRPIARLVATLGFVVTLFTIALALLPSPDEPNKPLAIFKTVGLSGVLVLTGVAVFYRPRIRAFLTRSRSAS